MIFSLHLLPHEHSVPGVLQLDDLNTLMIKWRKTYGRGPDAPQPTKLIVGKAELDYLMNLSWSSTPTCEFAARATKRDWYLASAEYLHDELRAGRGSLFGLDIAQVDEPSRLEMTS